MQERIGGITGFCSRYLACTGGLLLLVSLTGCSSSIYGWQVRTNSTELPPSFNPTNLEQGGVVVFPAITAPGLRGNEIGLNSYLSQILRKIFPNWNVVSERDTMTRINQQGLAESYTKLRSDYDQSNILDRDVLQKLRKTVGVRYVFQPRLEAFTQTMTDRWKFPALDIRLTQTRSSIMRISLQLWDGDSGELLWGSIAETTMESEAISQDPVYLEDIARATLGSIVSDFINRKRASKYTPLNKFLDDLIKDAIPDEKTKNGDTAGSGDK
jgi:hypothetical protein